MLQKSVSASSARIRLGGQTELFNFLPRYVWDFGIIDRPSNCNVIEMLKTHQSFFLVKHMTADLSGRCLFQCPILILVFIKTWFSLRRANVVFVKDSNDSCASIFCQVGAIDTLLAFVTVLFEFEFCGFLFVLFVCCVSFFLFGLKKTRFLCCSLTFCLIRFKLS